MRMQPLRDPDPPTPPAGGITPNRPAEPAAPAPAPPAQEELRMDLVGPDGKVYGFEGRDQLSFLATKGLEAYMRDLDGGKPAERPTEKPSETPSEASISDVMTRLDKMEQKAENEKRSEQIEKRKRELATEITTGLNDIPYLRDKPELRGEIETLVRNGLYAEPHKKISELIEKKAKIIIGEHYDRYIAAKKASRETAPAPSGGTGAPPVDDTSPKLTKEDLTSGKIRQRVIERLRSSNRERAGVTNFQ
jgi:hypothetical protein